MTTRIVGIATGVGITGLVVVGALVTAAMATVVEFSVFVGLPAGILAGVLLAVWARSALSGRPSDLTERGLSSVAVFGYCVILLFAVQYAVSAVRSLLTPYVIVGVGVIVAAAVFVYLGTSTKKRSPIQG